MNRRIYSIGIAIALLGAAAIWSASGFPLTATAATGEPHEEHDHAREAPPAHSACEKSCQPPAIEDHEAPDAHAGHGHEDDAPAPAGHGSGADNPADDAHDGHNHGGAGGICPEHRVPEEIDALCHADKIGGLHPGDGMMVRLGSLDVAARAGVRLAAPEAVSLAQGTAFPGRVAFNRNRLAFVSPLASGVVRKVYVQPGDRVSQGQVLADVAMPEMAALKAQFLAARAKRTQTEAAFLREKDLLERGITSRQEFQQAESEYHAARSASEQYRQQILNFGLPPESLQELLHTGDSSAVVAIRAPFDATVVEMQTAIGEMVAPGAPLFTLADLDLLWIELSLPESRIFQARLDAPVQARFSGLPDHVFTGRIFQLGAAVDERTRTLKVLAEVKNPDHRLKVGMFGQVRLLEGDEAPAMVVSAEALQSIDGDSFVFVQQEPDLFELRRVSAGAKKDGVVPILAGLSPGEQVVSAQGFALKSEVLKARLGASCADH